MSRPIPRPSSIAAVLVVLCLTGRAAGANTFVYVAVPGQGCSAAAEVVVVDAATAAVVTRLPLDVHFVPTGIAITDDGGNLFVSGPARICHSGLVPGTMIFRIDARRHVVAESRPFGIINPGRLVVRGNGPRMFMLASDQAELLVFESYAPESFFPTHQALPAIGKSFEYSSALDRVFVLSDQVRAYDGSSIALGAQSSLPSNRARFGMSLSRDAARLHVLTDIMQGFNPSTSEGARFVLDPASLAIVSELPTAAGAQAGGDPMESAGTDELLAVGLNLSVLRRFPLGSTGVSSTVLPGEGLAIAIPPVDTRAYVTTRAHPIAGGLNTLAAVDLASGLIVRTIPLAAAADLVTSTPAGAEACSYRVDGAYRSFGVAGGTDSIGLTTGCDWQAMSSEPWARLSATSGSATQTLTLTVDPNVFPTPRMATLTIAGQIMTVTQAGAYSQPPFGAFETPVDGARGVTGSIAVTGWALDDVGVARVRIFRDSVAGEGGGLVYIGDATFVEGSRPDVHAFMPDAPFANRAGWGLMVLTNVLPNGGTGTYRLSAFAEDVEGQTTLLGTKAFTAANSTASLPFGAIDTPGQGETVIGTIVNFGWTLTPSPGIIPLDGSTIDVLIDNVVVGHPTYNNFRADIASLFPGYANSGGAVGFFVLDTRTLTNGVHTIAWVVRDDLGRAQGIGSRFFTVFND